MGAEVSLRGLRGKSTIPKRCTTTEDAKAATTRQPEQANGLSIMSLALTTEHVCQVIAEWEPMGYPWNSWREDQTRYALIDPIIRALGWNTADPKECSIEHYLQNEQGEHRWVDYALFAERDIHAHVKGEAYPSILIEAKALRVPLDGHVEQLAWYVEAAKMTEGLGVLTNGSEWWIYDTRSLMSPSPLTLAKVDITKGRGGAAARILQRYLNAGRPHFG